MQWGLADFVVLGGAAGAGFGLLEQLLMCAEAGGKARPLDEGGWLIAKGLIDHPYVPGLGQIVGSWFPSPTGTTGVSGPVLPYEVYIFTSVLGGLAVGLLWCGARALTRAAAFPRNHTAMEWRERLAADWGLWIILATERQGRTAPEAVRSSHASSGWNGIRSVPPNCPARSSKSHRSPYVDPARRSHSAFRKRRQGGYRGRSRAGAGSLGM
ncbi:hypothetical protein ACWDSL_05515 [Streptomyces sp. NPDC000941]